MIAHRGPSPITWLVGALAIAPAEVAALGSAAPFFVYTTVVLLAGLGAVVGLVIAGTGWLARYLDLPAPFGACIGALPGAFPLAFVSVHLFDGGYAATLPGGSYGHIWLPVVGTILLAATLWSVDWLLGRTHGRLGLALALTAITIGVELVDRGVLPGLYPDVHAFLVVVAVVTAGAAVHLVWPPLGTATARLITAAALVAVVASVAVVLPLGLRAPGERLLVATRGMHARQLVRVVRTVADLDDDGYAAILGGGDCDDGAAEVHPGAVDHPGNGRDEDCDGIDAGPPVAVETSPFDYPTALAEWRATPQVSDVLARTRDYHAVVVLVDALRADALDPGRREELPRLHELADGARVFRRAFAPASGTDAVLATILTGRRDPFGAVDTTFVEAAAASGRVTHMVVPREVLRWAGKQLLTRGLVAHDAVVTDRKKRDRGSHTTSGEITDRGLAFLDRTIQAAGDSPEPVLLWLHYFDVHEHAQIERSDRRLRRMMRRRQLSDYGDKERAYRAASMVVDRELGRLVRELERRNLWDRTILVVASDHGESLGEEPRLGETHGLYLYNPLIHVPLLIRIPELSPAKIDQPVSLIDLPATVLGLIGAKPLAGADGRDLLPLLLDGASAELQQYIAPIALFESEQRGVIDWPYKLLVRPADNITELYDLADDFAEKRDLTAERPEVMSRLRAVLQGLPQVTVDRTPAGRKRREQLATPGSSGQ